MREKIKLPDVALEMISGGTLTHRGKTIQDLTVYMDMVEVVTSSGKEYLEFSADDRAAMEKDPSLQDQWLARFDQLHDNPGKYEIMDLMGFPK